MVDVDSVEGAAQPGPSPTLQFDEPEDGLSMEELERELPQLEFDMIPLGELLSRTAQNIHRSLVDIADTCVMRAMRTQTRGIDVRTQAAVEERQPAEARPRGLGREHQEAGRQDVRRCKMGTGWRGRAEGHGQAGILLLLRGS